MDLQSEAMVMVRKKLKDLDADGLAYGTKMTLHAALIELTLLSCEIGLLYLFFCSFKKGENWKINVADLLTASDSVTIQETLEFSPVLDLCSIKSAARS